MELIFSDLGFLFPMENATLYLFEQEFFTDKISVTNFINEEYKKINRQNTEADKNSVALTSALILNGLASNTKNISIKCKITIAEAYLLNFIGYRKNDLVLVDKAINRLDSISEKDINLSDQDVIWHYYYTKGEARLHQFLFSKDKNKSEYTIKNLNPVFEARKCFSFLFNKYLEGNLDIGKENIQKVIIYFCQTLGHLSRYVEPFFLLDKLEEIADKHKWAQELARLSLIECIKDKTCTSVSPQILIKIHNHLSICLKDKNLDIRNTPYLESLKLKVDKEATEHFIKTGKTWKELKKQEHKILSNLSEYSSYEKFVIEKRLGLNEHSLYCPCKKGITDNLSIKSTHEHTSIEWVNQFEIILNRILAEFDYARRSYFNALSNNEDYRNFNNSFSSEGVLNSSRELDLINSFKGCFSILDKIASAFNLAHLFITDEKKKNLIHFNSFFRQNVVKEKIDKMPNNLFAMALYSISRDLDKDFEHAEFHEYKDWRNAAEHTLLVLVDDNVDITKLQNSFPDVKYFVRQKEFEKKTFYLMHLCRSAIFSFVWAIRKQSIELHKHLNTN